MSFIGLDKHETKFDEEIENITTSEESYNSQVIYFLLINWKDFISDGDFDYEDQYFDLD